MNPSDYMIFAFFFLSGLFLGYMTRKNREADEPTGFGAYISIREAMIEYKGVAFWDKFHDFAVIRKKRMEAEGRVPWK